MPHSPPTATTPSATPPSGQAQRLSGLPVVVPVGGLDGGRAGGRDALRVTGGCPPVAPRSGSPDAVITGAIVSETSSPLSAETKSPAVWKRCSGCFDNARARADSISAGSVGRSSVTGSGAV